MDTVLRNTWLELGAVLAVYLCVALVLRARRPGTLTTVYEPPEGVSPALAAYLMEDGDAERAFAAALVSLAAKGVIKISQGRDWFELQGKTEGTAELPDEERKLCEACLRYPDMTCKFTAADFGGLGNVYEVFRESIESQAEPDYMSGHPWIVGAGIVAMFVILVNTFFTLPNISPPGSLPGVAYLAFWVILGAFCALAAVRIWAITLKKLVALLPFSNLPKRKFSWYDLMPIPVTCAAGFGFAFLVYLTSAQFAALCAAALGVALIGREVLETPTSKGYEAIAKLSGYREFLCRTETDHLNRENKPDATPDTVEPFSGYAVALRADQGWGEEFAAVLTTLVEFDRAYTFQYGAWLGHFSLRPAGTQIGDGVIQLDLDGEAEAKTAASRETRRKRVGGGDGND